MIIELRCDVQVRVPQSHLPYATKGAVFYTFKTGAMVNYSSYKHGPDHMVHEFTAQAPRFGMITHMIVIKKCFKPEWL